MIKALLLASCLVSACGQSFSINFRTAPLDFGQGNGTFATDHYAHPAGFLEIGGLGVADNGGALSYHLPSPMDFTAGHGSFGTVTETRTVFTPNPWYDPSRPDGPFNQPGTTTTITETKAYLPPRISLQAAPGEGSAPWKFTLFDGSGGSESLTFIPVTSPGVFASYAQSFGFDDDGVDWTDIRGFELSGDGSSAPFHAGFKTLAVIPEPSVYGAFFSVALGGFAIFRGCRRRKVS